MDNLKKIVRNVIREKLVSNINEASYTDYNLGKVQYTDKNMTPTDILSLAMAYVNEPKTKLAGRALDHRIKVANDLARLTGTVQMDVRKRGNQPALITHLLKNKLITKDEYVKLYKDLIAVQAEYIKTYLKKGDPASRMGSGSAARAAARKDMSGEFDESVNEANKSGDKLTHKHNPNIEIELIEPTNKGWKVYQIEKGKKKIAYFDKQDISGARALFESVNEAPLGKKRFMFDFYTDSNQRNTERETNFLATTLESAIKAAEHICKVTGYGYVEIYYKDLFLGSMKEKNKFEFVPGKGYSKFKSVNEGAGTLTIEKRKDGKYYWQYKFKSGKTEDWPEGFNTKADAQKDFIYRSKYIKESVNEGDENSPEEILSGLREMAMGDLERIADYANMIETRMKEGQELDSWMYSQITLAVDQLNSVHDTMDGRDGEREPMKEEKPGLWANIRAKKARGEKSAHGNSDAHKDAVKAGKKINNEETITEKQFKGIEGIPANKKLSQLSDAEKIKILQASGNIIDFIVPDWAKGTRNFWQVISKGSIKKKKNLGGDIIYFLPGKMVQSPAYSSVKELLNGVDWNSMEERRKFNESAADVTEMGTTDVHFKNILRMYDTGGSFTKKKVAVVVCNDSKATRTEVIDAMKEMDYEEISDAQIKLGISKPKN
jgi:hypothetical protein